MLCNHMCVYIIIYIYTYIKGVYCYLIYVFNVFILQCIDVARPPACPPLTIEERGCKNNNNNDSGDYCRLAERGSPYKLTLLNRVFSAFVSRALHNTPQPLVILKQPWDTYFPSLKRHRPGRRHGVQRMTVHPSGPPQGPGYKDDEIFLPWRLVL